MTPLDLRSKPWIPWSFSSFALSPWLPMPFSGFPHIRALVFFLQLTACRGFSLSQLLPQPLVFVTTLLSSPGWL